MKNSMKKLLVLIIAVLMLMLMPIEAAALDDRGEEKEKEKDKEKCNVQVICKKDKGSDKYLSWDLAIPQVQGLESQRVQASINKQLEKPIVKFKKELHAQAKKAYKESKKSKYPFRQFTAQTVYEVHYLDCNLLSLTIDMYQYTGGAHGLTTRLAFNFDLKTGKQLGYQDIFKDCVDYKTVIINEVTRQINQNPEYYFDDAIETVNKFTDDQPFYITSRGIVVYYGLYEIAPYASGIREFFIPFSAFTCE